MTMGDSLPRCDQCNSPVTDSIEVETENHGRVVRWTVESETAQLVERFMIESEWAAFNAMKIVPLGTYHNLVQTCKRLEESTE